MRKIEIDDDVFAHLQRHARPLMDKENDVLRRLLFDGGEDGAATSGGDTPRPPTNRPSRGTGDLMPYIEGGLLAAGDELEYRQPRKGLVHRARVGADGWIETDSGPFKKVSPSLKAYTGTEINGWSHWRRIVDGRRLGDLRDQLSGNAA